MAGFSYILNVTGDCSSQGVGVISILPSGGTPPYIVQWDTPSLPPLNTVFDTPSVRTGLYPGNYLIRLSDSSEPDNLEFYVNATVSSGVCASISNIFHTTCGTDNGAVTATSSTYLSSVVFELYTSGGTLLNSFNSNTAEAQFNGLSAGTYYVSVTDIGGCTARTSDFIILDSAPLSFGLYTVPNSACSDVNTPIGKIYVTGQTGTPPYTYLWSTNATGSTVTGLTEGFYSVTVTDSNGCSSTQNTEITNVSPLGLSYFSAVTPTCFTADGSLIVNITGGTAPYYYSASTGNVDISYSQSFTLTGLAAGNYTIVITDAGLCQIVTSSNLQTPQSIGDITIDAFNSTCSSNDGRIEVFVGQGVPPFTYTLVYPDSSNTSVVTNSPSKIYNSLSAGTYNITIQNTQSCVYSQDVTIFTSNLFTLACELTGTTCNSNNGTIKITKSSGGTEPFTYSIDGVNYFVNTSLSSVTINNISSGNHLVKVTDANGCSQTKTVFINQSSPVNFTLFSTGCGNGNQGTLTAFISSGTPPLTFNWSNNVSGNPQDIFVDSLTAGTYSLTIVDTNGCSLQRTATISCTQLNSGYVPFKVGSQTLTIINTGTSNLTKLLNDGFQDLTNGDPNCILNSAEFIAEVSVTPVGLNLQSNFYTGTTLLDIPATNLWYNEVETLLLSVPGVQSVNIDPLTNQISITKVPSSTYLNGQVINISIAIDYDISC